MIALCSPKGTGKTKLIATLLTDQERVLSLTHRIALCRVTRDERETLTGLLLDQLITLNQRGEDTRDKIQALCEAEKALLEEGYPQGSINSRLVAL